MFDIIAKVPYLQEVVQKPNYVDATFSSLNSVLCSQSGTMTQGSCQGSKSMFCLARVKHKVYVLVH